MRISDWSSDVCSSDLDARPLPAPKRTLPAWRYRYDRQRKGVRGGDASRKLSKGQDRGAIPSNAAAQRNFVAILEPSAPRAVGKGDMRLARFRSEEHTSELQSLMRISYAVFCLTKKKTIT